LGGLQVAVTALSDSGGSVQAAAEALLAHAQKRRSKDDISVIAISIAAEQHVADPKQAVPAVAV
jgi:serine/threonine protein phosphatase PrpC